MNPGRGKRRALAHVGGPVTTTGSPQEAAALAAALRVWPATDAPDDPVRAHVHGFHTYAARMHPVTAARLVEAFAPHGGRVLDPFCGSGTVLVEGLIRGCDVTGTDLNPLAVWLSRCKTRPRSATELTKLLDEARSCAASADERRRFRLGATRRLDPDDVRLFEPHVLMELDSLKAAISRVSDVWVRRDLLLVLSSLLVKLSRRAGDTSTRTTEQRTAPGFATRLFTAKAEDLARRLAALSRMVPPGRHGTVEEDDATQLRTLPDESVDAVVTSPPYAGTYDYHSHHELRFRWLGLDDQALRRHEFGSRSKYRSHTAIGAVSAWKAELSRFLRAAHRVLRPGGSLVLLMADSAVAGMALRADRIVAELADETGFTWLACASQPRPHFHRPTAAAFRDRPRAEHAMALRKPPGPTPRPNQSAPH